MDISAATPRQMLSTRDFSISTLTALRKAAERGRSRAAPESLKM
jgi:hypothetical protein